PMFLMGLGVRVPDRLFVHGLLMMKDGKMSKSKGNVVSPYPLIERYGVDAVRYYLTREVVFGSDGQFTPEQFVERINNDLANDFGNLLNRTLAMINKYFDGVVPAYQGDITAFDKALRELAEETIKEYEADLDDLKITDAFTKVNNLVAKANKYIDDTAPWALNKDESKRDELASVMSHLANVLFIAGMLMKPILVRASEKLFDQLGLKSDQRAYENIYKFGYVSGIKINKSDPLFPRLDPAIEVPYIQELMK
ncbi:MAG TPA: class I tRNA ligase family protein, partial [Bacilli bacterium]|nr:class I tRNA ligase family protein [Bacilli bacterium]